VNQKVSIQNQGPAAGRRFAVLREGAGRLQGDFLSAFCGAVNRNHPYHNGILFDKITYLRRPGARRPDQAGRTAFPPARWGASGADADVHRSAVAVGEVLEKRRRDPLRRHRDGGGGNGRSDLQLDGARAVGLERSLAGGPSAPATLGFGLCLVGSLTVRGVHLGTARHCRIPLWFGLLSPACYAAVAILAWSSLVLRRAGRVKSEGRTYEVARGSGPGLL